MLTRILERRFSEWSLSFLASYTFGHAIDDSTRTPDVTQDARNLQRARGNCKADRPSAASTSCGLDEVNPSEKSKRGRPKIVWSVEAFETFQSGQPCFIAVQPFKSNGNTGSTRDRPDIAHVLDGSLFVTSVQPVIQNRSDKAIYLNAGAFSTPDKGEFGNAPPAITSMALEMNNWDLMLGIFPQGRLECPIPGRVL